MKSLSLKGTIKWKKNLSANSHIYKVNIGIHTQIALYLTVLNCLKWFKELLSLKIQWLTILVILRTLIMFPFYNFTEHKVNKHHRPSDLFANTVYLLIFQIFIYISGVLANKYLYFRGTSNYSLIFRGYQHILTYILGVPAYIYLYFAGTSIYLLIFQGYQHIFTYISVVPACIYL